MNAVMTGSALLSRGRLLIKDVLLGASCMMIGDQLSQARNGDKVDLDRTARMSLVGSGIGVIGHVWYPYLDRRFPGKRPHTVSRKLIRELFASPGWALYSTFAHGLLSGHSVSECINDYRVNVVNIFKLDCSFYLPLQLVNYLLVPARHRFPGVCAIVIAYDIFLSMILHKDQMRVSRADHDAVPDLA